MSSDENPKPNSELTATEKRTTIFDPKGDIRAAQKMLAGFIGEHRENIRLHGDDAVRKLIEAADKPRE